MVRAIWNGSVIAESDETIVVEGNHYFPPESVNKELLKESHRTTVCFWKGTARYYDIQVNGDTNAGAAWYYPKPSDAAAKIKDYIAFWHGVKVQG
jgi:uncharacterized protein (DUF427 family)